MLFRSGVDVDAGSTDGAAVGLVSMAGSWTAGPASPGAGASDSWAAKLPDTGGAVELSSTATAGLQGAPAVTKMVLRACLARDSMRLLIHVAKVHIALAAASVRLEEVVSPIGCDSRLLAQPLREAPWLDVVQSGPVIPHPSGKDIVVEVVGGGQCPPIVAS